MEVLFYILIRAYRFCFHEIKSRCPHIRLSTLIVSVIQSNFLVAFKSTPTLFSNYIPSSFLSLEALDRLSIGRLELLIP